MEPKILKEMPDRYPTNGTFELTVRCNLHCKMCLFRHDDSENADLIKNEMTAHEWIDMARQVAEAGTMNLLITGGEPMLRPDFCEIWEGIYKQGFIIELYTNATLVTPKIMETLRKYPPHKIGVTIYGASKETYEKVCGNGEAFDRMLEGIQLLSQLPSVVEFRTTLIKDNVDDVFKMENIVNNILKKKTFIIHSKNIIKAVRGGCAEAEKCRLSPEETIDLKLNRASHLIDDFFYEKGVRIPEYEFFVEEKKTSKKKQNIKYSLFHCNAGMDSYTITWNGKLIPCQLLGVFSTDARKEGFGLAWEYFPYKVRLPEECQCTKCEYENECSACYAIRFAETGTLNTCASYFKELAKIVEKYKKKGGDKNEGKEDL
ncbi:MAG: radical SAM/SPASM domain-containing protein [Floccifex porci]|uniref:radical SAM/SPASM domain-containing protein n=1 Tax=Floccifex porci TaxID=2606629 RepID=UPI003F0176BF